MGVKGDLWEFADSSLLLISEVDKSDLKQNLA